MVTLPAPATIALVVHDMELTGSPSIGPPARRDDLAIVLDGGGARAAYQVGLLRGWRGVTRISGFR